MNKKLTLISIILFFVCSIATSLYASAITVKIEPVADIEVGKTTTLKVFLNTEGQEINVFEGSLEVHGDVNIFSLNSDGSVFNIWTQNPIEISPNEISFAGGVAGGVYGNNLQVLNFDITPTEPGKITVDSKNLAGYLDDGKGTKIIASQDTFEVNAVASISQKNTHQTTSHTQKFSTIILLLCIVLIIIYASWKIIRRKNK